MKKIIGICFMFCLIICQNVFAFSDVSEDYWAYSKIDALNKSGIISGFEDGTFKPGNTITREQAASVMTNFFELSLKEEVKTFEDIESGYWSEPYAQLAGQYMPIDEIDGKYYFRPKDNATRIEIAKSIIKIIGFDDETPNYQIIESFNDKDKFNEEDKKYIALVAENEIMVGDDNLEFRPDATITRAEFCALIYNVYTKRGELKEKNQDKVVMTVNGEDVLYSEFSLYLKLQKKIYETMLGDLDIWTAQIDGRSFYDIVKESTREEIILNTLKLQKAKELGVTLSDEIETEAKEYLDTESATEVYEHYGITPEQLLKINLDGTLIEELAKVIYEEEDHLGHDHLDINGKIDRVYYSPRHILLSTVDKTEEEKAEVKKLAEELLNRIKEGEDFATLAKEYSEDAGSKDNGGLYENVKLGEFVPEFEEAALATQVGNIYPELVETKFGYHIIRVEAKETIAEDLTTEEKQEIMDNDLDNMAKDWLKDAEININEEVYKSL